MQPGFAVWVSTDVHSLFQEETNHIGVPVFTRPKKAKFHLLFGGVRFQTAVGIKISFDRIEMPCSRGSFQVQARATFGKIRRSGSTSVMKRRNHRVPSAFKPV